MLIVESRRKSIDKLKATYPGCRIVDVTSKAEDEYVKFSPFYPHGNIPVPFSSGIFSKSVEGIWQGLKVFESTGVDPKKFRNDTMKNLKRTVRKFGPVRGHQKGMRSEELLDYLTARREIFLPAYEYVLRERVSDLVKILRIESQHRDVVLLDYETNTDIENLRKPLSHAGLIRRFILAERKVGSYAP